MGLPEFCGNLIADGIEQHPPRDGKHHAERNYSCRVVGDCLVKTSDGAGESRHYKVIRDAHDQNGKCTQSKDNESSEDEDVKSASESIARMLPLAEPILEDVADAQQRVVKSEVALRPHQGDESAPEDVCKAQQAKNMHQPEQEE